MSRMKKTMIKVASKASIGVGVASTFLFGMPSKVAAQGVLPGFIQNIIDALKIGETGGTNKYINDRVRVGLTVLFVAVFLVAIAYSALAAIKFISSQGESGKLEESKAAVKAILMGFAAMIVAIVGIFIVLWIMGAGTETPDTEFCVDPNDPTCVPTT